MRNDWLLEVFEETSYFRILVEISETIIRNDDSVIFHSQSQNDFIVINFIWCENQLVLLSKDVQQLRIHCWNIRVLGATAKSGHHRFDVSVSEVDEVVDGNHQATTRKHLLPTVTNFDIISGCFEDSNFIESVGLPDAYIVSVDDYRPPVLIDWLNPLQISVTA